MHQLQIVDHDHAGVAVFARDLDHAVLEHFAYREEVEQVQQMRAAGIISEDLARFLRSEAESIHSSRRLGLTVDMRATTPELLRGFPVFSALSEEELGRVAKRLQVRVFAADAIVFRRGDRADGMYFIASGAVEIAVGQEHLRLGRGDFFGEMALLDQTRRTAAVRSISYSHLLFLPRAAFEEIGGFSTQEESMAAFRAMQRPGERTTMKSVPQGAAVRASRPTRRSIASASSSTTSHPVATSRVTVALNAAPL